jgi:hypothetical protein
MIKKEGMALTITKTTYLGQVKFNGGRKIGQRYGVETAEDLDGQVWVMNEGSLRKNYPIGKTRKYDVAQMEYLGELTWKIEVVRTEDLSADDKEQVRNARRKYEACASQTIPAPKTPSVGTSTRDSTLVAAAVLGAAILAAGGKEAMDKIGQRALALTREMEALIHGPGKNSSGGAPITGIDPHDDDAVPF